MTEPEPVEPDPPPVEPKPEPDPLPVEPKELTPEEVAAVPGAVIDEGVPGEWPAIVDPERVIATLWRKVAALETLAVEHGTEINGIEATLGLNPQGTGSTVADRLTAIEGRLTELEMVG